MGAQKCLGSNPMNVVDTCVDHLSQWTWLGGADGFSGQVYHYALKKE